MTWTQPVRIGSLTCIPLHPTFGAEVRGVNFTQPVSEEQLRDIIAAQDRFGVTVYRSSGLDDAGQVRFSKQLGKCERSPKLTSPNEADPFAFPELFAIRNIDGEGHIIKSDTRTYAFNKANQLWHVDSSFNQHRSKYSMLRAHIIPRVGGDTRYADVRTAYRNLPESTKAQLRGLIAKHDLWHSRRTACPEEYKEIMPREKEVYPPAYHNLIQIAPDGRETLFIASHVAQFAGMTPQESQKLAAELIRHCTQSQYVLRIKWEQPGDLVFWDNRAVMHSATEFADQNEKRDMRRTTVLDDGPYAVGVPEAAKAFS